MNGEMDEGMCGLSAEKGNRVGFAGPEERSHEPDKSVLWRWKTSLERFVIKGRKRTGKKRRMGGGSPTEMGASAVGTKGPTRFVCHVR